LKTGRYFHDNDKIFTKVFEGPNGGKRTFRVLVSNAYDAGIIGPEHNGVVVLDEDFLKVVADQIGRGQRPELQAKIAAHLMSLDWPEFTAWLAEPIRDQERNFPADFHLPKPSYQYPLPAAENWAVMDIDSEGPADDPISYPSKLRTEIIAELAKHQMHHDRGPWRLAWDIKVGNYDDTGYCDGKAPDVDYPPNPEHDERWQEYLENHDDAFNEVCSEALNIFVSDSMRIPGIGKTRGLYTTYPGADQGDYGFSTEGRSGGWLVLTEIEGIPSNKLQWSGQKDMENVLMTFSKEQLKKLYRLVRNVDHDITPNKITAEINYRYSSLRSSKEEEWSDEAELAAAPLTPAKPATRKRMRP
jgi:hypothetical protein